MVPLALRIFGILYVTTGARISLHRNRNYEGVMEFKNWTKDESTFICMKKWQKRKGVNVDQFCLVDLKQIVDALKVGVKSQTYKKSVRVSTQWRKCQSVKNEAWMRICNLKGKKDVRVSYSQRTHVPKSCLRIKSEGFKPDGKHEVEVFQAAVTFQECKTIAMDNREGHDEFDLTPHEQETSYQDEVPPTDVENNVDADAARESSTTSPDEKDDEDEHDEGPSPRIVGQDEECNPSLPPEHAAICSEGYKCEASGLLGATGKCVKEDTNDDEVDEQELEPELGDDSSDVEDAVDDMPSLRIVGLGEECNPSLPPEYASICDEGLRCENSDLLGGTFKCVKEDANDGDDNDEEPEMDLGKNAPDEEGVNEEIDGKETLAPATNILLDEFNILEYWKKLENESAAKANSENVAS